TVTAVQAVYAEFKKTLTLTPTMRTQLDQAVQNWTVPTISFPPGNLYGGLFDLATFGHEDVGHNVIHSVPGLREELSTKISHALPGNLGQYWADRVDETASDIMGILHGGPAVALAFVYSLRGQGKLLFTAIAGDVHPVDVLRAFVAQAAIRSLNTTDSQSYITQLDSFIDRSLNKSNIQISVYETITREQGKTSAQTVTDLILNSPLRSLGNRSLSSIRKWNEQDQRIATTIRQNMYAGQLQNALTQSADEYAFHAVAAAIAEAADSRIYHGKVGIDKVQLIFQHTITILETMHLYNPRWSQQRDFSVYDRSCECVLV
ncbi:MAG: hypothetical protein KDK65_04175, partial [Chlamydiia bacterium]|nr:hypothetical protein [Chlamydiia bacterium]